MLIKKHLTKPPNQTPNKFDFNLKLNARGV